MCKSLQAGGRYPQKKCDNLNRTFALKRRRAATRALAVLGLIVLFAWLPGTICADAAVFPSLEQLRHTAEKCSKSTTRQQCIAELPAYEQIAFRLEKNEAAYTSEAIQIFDSVAHCHQQLEHYAIAEQMYQRAVEIKEHALGADHPEVATSLNNLAVLYCAEEKYAEAETPLIRARAIWEKAPNHDSLDAAQSLLNLASVYQAQGNLRKAEPLYVRVLQTMEQQGNAEHPVAATALNNLAVLYQTQGKYGQSETLLLHARMIWDKTLGSDHPDSVQALHNLAWGYQAQGKFGQAEFLYLRALAIREKMHHPEDREFTKLLINLASLYKAQKKLNQAEPLYVRALRIMAKTSQPRNPDLTRALAELADLYRTQHKLTQAFPFLVESRKAIEWQAVDQCFRASTAEQCELALPACEQAAVLVAKSTSDNSSAMANVLHQWANCHYQISVDTKSIEDVNTRFVLAVARPVPSSLPTDPARTDSRDSKDEEQQSYRAEIGSSVRASFELQQAQTVHARKAEELYRKALELREKALIPDQLAVEKLLNALAILLQAQGRYEAAEPLFVRALKIQETSLGPDHPDLGVLLHNLAVRYQAQGQMEKAEPLFARALQIFEKAPIPKQSYASALLTNLAFSQGQHLEQAEALYLEALQSDEKLWGPDDPRVAQTLLNLSVFYRDQKKIEQAESLRSRALHILGRPAMAQCEQADTVEQCEQALPACMHAVLQAEQEMGTYDLATAKTIYNLAYCRQQLAHDSIAEALYLRVLEIEKHVLGPDAIEQVTVLDRLAEMYQMQHKYEQAEKLLGQALQIQEKALGPDPSLAAALNNLAALRYKEGIYFSQTYVSTIPNFDEYNFFVDIFNKIRTRFSEIKIEQAELLLLQAVRIQEKTENSNSLNFPRLLNNLAVIYHEQNKNEQAENLLRRALRIEDSSSHNRSKKSHPYLSNTLATHRVRSKNLYMPILNISNMRFNINKQNIELPENIKYLENLIALNSGKNMDVFKSAEMDLHLWQLLRPMLGSEHPDVIELQSNLDSYYYNLYQSSDQAESLFLLALKIHVETLGDDSIEVIPELFRLASLYQRKKQYRQAEPLLLRALHIQEKTWSSDHLEVDRSLADIANVYREEKKYAQAESMLIRALEDRKKNLRSNQPEITPWLSNLALIYKDQGKLEQSESLYTQALQIQEKTHGPEHPKVALALDRLAALYIQKGNNAKAEMLLQRAVKIQDKESPIKLIEALNSPPWNIYLTEGRFFRFGSALSDELLIEDQERGEKTTDSMSPRRHLVELYLQQGQFDRAEALLISTLQRQDTSSGYTNNWVIDALKNLVEQYERQAKNDQAESLLERALQSVNNKSILSTMPLLEKLADLYSEQGKEHLADQLLLQKADVGQGSSNNQETKFLDLATMTISRIKLIFQGNFNPFATTAQCSQAETVDQCQAALPICELELAKSKAENGDNNLVTAQAFYNLAYCHDRLADKMVIWKNNHALKAKINLHRALEIKQQVLGPDSLEVAAWIVELGHLYARSGRYALAERLYLSALQIQEKALGPEHIDVIRSMIKLGELYYRQGKYRQTEQLYLRLLKIWGETWGPNHLEYIEVRKALIALYLDQKRYEDVKLLKLTKDEIEEIYLFARNAEKNKLLKHLNARFTSHQLFDLYPDLKEENYKEIFRRQTEKFSFQKDWIMELKQINSGRFDVRWTSVWLQFIWAMIHNRKIYNDDMIVRNYMGTMQDQYFRLSMATSTSTSDLSEESKLIDLSKTSQMNTQGRTETNLREIFQNDRLANEGIYALVYDDPNKTARWKQALATALVLKGRATDVGAWANRVLHQDQASANQRQLFDQLQQTRQQYEFLLYSGPYQLSAAVYQRQLQFLSLTADELEGQIMAEQVRLHQVLPELPEQILSTVAQRLPVNSALLEVVRVNQFRYDGSRYLAMLLFPDGRIEAIDLGESSLVDSNITDFLVAVQNRLVDPIPASQVLYQQIFAKVREKLGGTRKLYLSMDGLLNLVPFAALHDGKDYLLSHYVFTYLTSGRDLLREPVRTPTQPPLILADPDFQASLSAPQFGSNGTVAINSSNPSTLYQQIKGIARLPGTRSEAAALQQLLKVTPLLGAQATEEAVRRAQGPIILHIASHGLLLEDSTVSSTIVTDSRQSVLRHAVLVGLEENSSQPLPQDDANALNRSVLLLAGAEHADQAVDSAHDGLLSAAEVQSLNLLGTQLVVLSACDTGKGAISTGQGIYGLRSAFLVAGAETLVTSLWPVSDRNTSELMVSYYRKLIQSRQPRVAAMEEAMQEMKAQHPHPYYWAPFIVIGQDGPLRGLSAH